MEERDSSTPRTGSDNPYTAPESDVSVSHREAGVYYRPAHIAIATLIGTLAAGTWLIAENYRQNGKFEAQRQAFGVGGSIALVQILLPVLFPRQVPVLSIGAACVVGAWIYANEVQQPFIHSALHDGGKLQPLWRSLAVGVLGAVLVVVAIAILVTALDSLR